MSIPKLYVKKNIKSLDKMAMAVARYLKCGESVQILYGKDERDIVVRFQQRVNRIYDEEQVVEYPEEGSVIYYRHRIATNTEQQEIKRTYILEYDSWGSRFRRVKETVSAIWNDIMSYFDNKERW